MRSQTSPVIEVQLPQFVLNPILFLKPQRFLRSSLQSLRVQPLDLLFGFLPAVFEFFAGSHFKSLVRKWAECHHPALLHDRRKSSADSVSAAQVNAAVARYGAWVSTIDSR
jgi:hypothetical protein